MNSKEIPLPEKTFARITNTFERKMQHFLAHCKKGTFENERVDLRTITELYSFWVFHIFHICICGKLPLFQKQIGEIASNQGLSTFVIHITHKTRCGKLFSPLCGKLLFCGKKKRWGAEGGQAVLPHIRKMSNTLFVISNPTKRKER